ncbi:MULTISPECIES: hypothetical protein [unclassified Acidovorax]|uniref:hypothetical protein n=1 Tax=unclassified Acidovorax TaxID=2684926 RepID=UPI000C4A033F|nr:MULTISPECIES: hypothetical protein [unclassified Acidovorax]PIF17783.1 hypothetical protein CLU87_1711 [Acidovorax sp. 59]PKW03193.1 hypothetical protein CLU89_2852 [Acidovorax sp. 30]
MEKFIDLSHTQMGGVASQIMSSETTEKSTEQFLILRVGEGWPITRFAQTARYTEPFLILLAGAAFLTLSFGESF